MKKSRKKILLSSIAMLLVALVALGSATFAWFSVNKTVVADSIKVQAIAADGLVINNEQTANWLSKVSFQSTTTALQPVSYNAAVGAAMPNGFIAKDVKQDGGAVWASSADDTKVASFVQAPALPSSTYSDDTLKFNSTANVARYDVDVASSGEVINKAVNVRIQATGTGTTYAKAALVKDGSIIAFYTDGQSYNAITSTAPAIGSAITTATTSATAMTSVPQQANAQAFQLYVWFEGNDPQCLDANQTTSNTNFTLTFTLAD
jgi:hypothetical protein